MIEKFGEFQITEYESADFEPLAELFREVYIKTYPHFDVRLFEPERFRAIVREFTLPRTKVWTAKKDSEFAGFLALKPNFIDQLYIRENHQSKGLGGFLIDRAKTIYPSFLELYTFAANEKAIAFYEKRGFEIIERGIAPDEKMPDVKMLWKQKN